MSVLQKIAATTSLIACLILSGCQRAESPSVSLQSPVKPEPASSVPFVPSPEPPNIASVEAWSTFEWTAGGGLAIRRREHVDFTDKNGVPTHTFSPKLETWPEAPELQIWGESFCDYAYSEKYILAWFHFFGNPAIMLAQGSPTLADAVILNLDGIPARVFPSGVSPGMSTISGIPEFELSIARRTHFYWLEDEILAIDAGADVWLYNVQTDELQRAADYRAEVYSGWTAMESHGYGTVEDASWAKDGALYYAVNHGYDASDSHNPISSLWRVAWGDEPFNLAGDETFTGFCQSNGYPFAFISDYRLEADGSRTPYCRIWYVNESSGTLDFIGTSNQYMSPIARHSLAAWTSYAPTDLPYLHVLQSIDCYDLDTGERTDFTPRADNGGFPADVRLIDLFSLFDVSRGDDGYLLYYYFVDVVREERAPGDFIIYLACHSTASGKTSFTLLHTADLHAMPGESPAASFLAIEQESRSLALLPLPVPPG